MRRIALYSHDAQGLGHMRRNIAIASVLADARHSSILLIAGAREAARFPLPRGTDTLALPALRKDDTGRYSSRSLGLDVESMVDLRAATLHAALAAFQPDVMIVDKLPSGVHRELATSFDMLGRDGHQARARHARGPRRARPRARRVGRRRVARRAASPLRRRLGLRRPARLRPRSSSTTCPPTSRGRSATAATSTASPSAAATAASARASTSTCPTGGCRRASSAAARTATSSPTRSPARALPEGATGAVVTGPFMPAHEQARIAALVARARRHAAARLPARRRRADRVGRRRHLHGRLQHELRDRRLAPARPDRARASSRAVSSSSAPAA